MTMAKKLPLLAPSIHTFEVNGTYTDCEARRAVFTLNGIVSYILYLVRSSALWQYLYEM